MKFDIQELKKRANTVAIIGRRMTLKQEGDHYVGCCPIHGEKTPSFKLDQRQGEWLWKCFGCGKGGDVLRFIELADKVDVKKAIEILEKETVTNDPEWEKAASKAAAMVTPLNGEKKAKVTMAMEQWEAFVNRLKNSPEALKWLKDVRGIEPEIAFNMMLGFVKTHKCHIDPTKEAARDKGWICMPRIMNGKVVAVKLRSIVDKVFTQLPNMDGTALFNIECVNAMEPVYVTEGEFDACILAQAGFQAVSVPSAGATLTPENIGRLKQAAHIYLAGDNDSAGSDSAKKLLMTLGSNTHQIVWPEGIKDANDLFRSDAIERDIPKMRSEVLRASYLAKNKPPAGYRSLIDSLRDTETVSLKDSENRVHWPSNMGDLDNAAYTPVGDSIIIYSSYSGTGKSMLKTQLLLNEAKRGEVVVDLSPEIRNEEYLALVTSQLVGPELEGGLRRTGVIEKEHFMTAANMLDKPTEKGTDFRYYIGHAVNAGSEDETLALLRQIILLTGATRFAVDTFHRLFNDNGRFSQTEAEGRMAKKLEELGKELGCTFILVCQSNAEAEGIENIKKDAIGTLRGSRELQDAACTIYVIHRKRTPRHEGEEPERSLELETSVYVNKARYSGTGKPVARLLLVENWSLFVPKSGAQEPTPPQAEAGANYDPEDARF